MSKIIAAILKTVSVGVLVCAVGGLAAHAQGNPKLGEKKVLTLGVAKKIAAAMEAEMCTPRCAGVIAIVDDAGNLINLERNENTQLASVEIAIQKARTAAIYERPTKMFDDRLTHGETFYLSFPNMVPVVGGVPLVVDHQVIGGIGESGYVRPGEGNLAGKITAIGVAELKKIVSATSASSGQ